MKILLLILAVFGAFKASTQAAPAIPFYGGGWEEVFGRQFETRLNEQSDRATLDVQSFWSANGPKEVKAAAITFLKRAKENGSSWAIDPDNYEVSIVAIRLENLSAWPLADSKAWYVIIELSAWGKGQHTGLPLWFRLVMIPGHGFKTPTLMSKTFETLNPPPGR